MASGHQSAQKSCSPELKKCAQVPQKCRAGSTSPSSVRTAAIPADQNSTFCSPLVLPKHSTHTFCSSPQILSKRDSGISSACYRLRRRLIRHLARALGQILQVQTHRMSLLNHSVQEICSQVGQKSTQVHKLHHQFGRTDPDHLPAVSRPIFSDNSSRPLDQKQSGAKKRAETGAHYPRGTQLLPETRVAEVGDQEVVPGHHSRTHTIQESHPSARKTPSASKFVRLQSAK